VKLKASAILTTTKVNKMSKGGLKLPVKMDPLPKHPQEKKDLGKVQTAHSVFSNDTSSFNNDAYHVHAYTIHTVIIYV